MIYTLLIFAGCLPPKPDHESLENMSEMHIRYFGHGRKTISLYPSLEMLDDLCTNSDDSEYTFFYLRDRIKRLQGFADDLPKAGIAKTNYIVEFSSVDLQQSETFEVGSRTAWCDIKKSFQTQKTMVQFETYEANDRDNFQKHKESVYWMNIDNKWYLLNTFEYIIHNDRPFRRRQ